MVSNCGLFWRGHGKPSNKIQTANSNSWTFIRDSDQNYPPEFDDTLMISEIDGIYLSIFWKGRGISHKTRENIRW
jgi:hypothetical protein